MEIKNLKTEVQELNDTVIKNGFCIGCGACTAVKNSPFKIEFDEYTKFKAVCGEQNLSSEAKVLTVCPFSDKSKNEDELGQLLFKNSETSYNNKLGYFLNNYAGYVSENNFRENGSSGGLGSWILTELFKNKLVDAVIHVHDVSDKNTGGKTLFKYSLSTSVEEIKKGAKSRYYPIELSEVLNLIKERPAKYAIVGIPCFIKSIRLLAEQDNLIKERIKFCVGLVCGHLKSTRFAGMFSWQLGIHPNEMKKINFRTKLPGSRAVNYGVTVEAEKKGELIKRTSPPVNQVYGQNWGWGFFKYKACDFCDDVVSETADVTIGDAWLPQYMADDKGTNILIVRNAVISELVKKARQEKRLQLDDLSEAETIKSQKAGFFHRREGLAYRLHLTDQEQEWRPQKRVKASNNLEKKKKKIQKLRVKIRAKSHTAFNKAIEENSFSVFKEELKPLISEYEKLYAPSILSKIKRKLKTIVN